MMTPEQIAALTPDERRALLARMLAGGAAPAPAPPAPPPDAPRTYPASFAQERMWFMDQLQPGIPAYNLPVVLRVPVPMDEAILERVLAEVAARHESLRTTFRTGDDRRPVQVVHPPAPVPLTVIDLREMEKEAREEEAQRIAFVEARTPFDLAAGPVMRATLVRLAAEDHLLLLTLHHIVGDGWSLGVLFRELSMLYDAFASGRPSPLPPLPIQYADFAVWQRRQLSGAALEAHLAYWRGQLAGAPPLIQLPADRPRPPVASFRGGMVPLAITPETTERLRAAAQRAGATLYMTLLAAFGALLHRWGAGDDVVIGSPIASRTRSELEGLIGFFANTLVLRTRLEGDPPFLALLERVKQATVGAYAHQDLPFEKLVEELAPERSLAHNPLFQVAFSFQNAGSAQAAQAGSAPPPDAPDTGSGTAKFDLMLALGEAGGGVIGALEFAADLFDPPTVMRMADHFVRLVNAVADDPEARISTLPVMGEEETEHVVRTWNARRTEWDPADSAVARFDRQAAARPDAAAVVHEGAHLTYGALRARADALARRLRTLGVGPEQVVGACLERSPELVVAILGILRAGGAYLPLDPAHPAERLSYLLRDAGVRVVLTTEALRDSVPSDAEVRVVCLDAADADPVDDDAPLPLPAPESLAYVIYTSGSTGRPKGVMVQHRELAWLVSTMSYAEITPDDRVALATAPSFDPSVMEIFGALCHGARLVVFGRDEVLSGRGFVQRLRERTISVLYQTAPLFRQVVRQTSDAFRTLRVVMVGGEAIEGHWFREVLRGGPPRRLIHMYGPTETTVVSCYYDVRHPDGFALGPPIGHPVENTTQYVLDARLRPVPVGVPGELYIGGDCVARGYLGRPSLTAERFIPDPFGAVPGARLYRSGDLARWRADGEAEFLGRADSQVKVRGFRVEPGEVESVLAAHPDVGVCAVVAGHDAGGDARLVAYVVPPPGGRDAGVAELRGWMRERLPEHMVPAFFVPLEALPLMPSGKVDRGRLPDPEAARPALEEAFVAPRTPVEEAVAAMWGEVLGMERVGVMDNFFELGGHSLMCTQVASRVREAFGVELPLRAFFEHPTVAGLSLAIIRSQAEDTHGDDLADLLSELEALPDEEAQALLAEGSA
jgi:amino acid adenylation domain-containing protein